MKHGHKIVYVLVPGTIAMLHLALWVWYEKIYGAPATPGLILLPEWNMEPTLEIPRIADGLAVFLLGIIALGPLLLHPVRHLSYREQDWRDRWELCAEAGFVFGVMLGTTALYSVADGIYFGDHINAYGALTGHFIAFFYTAQRIWPKTANHTDSGWKRIYNHGLPLILSTLPGICFSGGTNMVFVAITAFGITFTTSAAFLIPILCLFHFAKKVKT